MRGIVPPGTELPVTQPELLLLEASREAGT